MPPISVGHGPGPVHVAGLYATPPAGLPTGPVPALVTNASNPQAADYCSPAFGFAAVFATALLSSSSPLAPEQSYGLHAAHNQEYAVTRTIFAPAAKPPPSSALGVFIAAGPQADPTQVPALVFVPFAAPQGAVPALVTGSPQPDPTQVAALVIPSAAALKTAALGQIVAGPQADPTQVPGALFGAALAQGQVPPYIQIPQQAYVDPPSFVTVSARGTRSQPFALVQAAPQAIDLTQQGSIFAPTSTPQRFLISQVWASPQSVDLTLQGFISAPLPATPKVLVASISASPQGIDLTLQGFITPTAPAKQGPTIPYVVGQPQGDPTQPAAVLFKPLVAATVPVATPIRQVIAAPQADPSQPQQVISAPALATSIASQAGRYRHGTHAEANYEYAVTRTVIQPPFTVQGKVPPLVLAPPQSDPTQIQGAIFRPLSAPTQTVRQIVAGPQSDPTQLPAIVSSPLTTAQGKVPALVSAPPQADPTQPPAVITPAAKPSPSTLANVVAGAPQTVDLTLQAALSTPQGVIQGKVPGLVIGRPQDDPTQIQAQFWPSLRTPPVIPNPVTAFFVTTPQFEERPTTVVWPSVRAGQRAPVLSQLSAAPQLDLTQQGWVLAPLPSAPRSLIVPLAGGPQLVDLTQQGSVWISPTRQGGVPPTILIGPQQVDFTLQGQITAPPSALQGKVPALVSAPPQADPSQIAPLFTPSTRAPPVTSGKLGAFVTTLPQFEERVTDQIFPSQRAGRLPPVITQLAASPQGVDLTIQGFITKPLPAPPVTGKTIVQFSAGMPQQSTELNSSALWTNCTFTPPSALPSTCMWGSTWKPTFT